MTPLNIALLVIFLAFLILFLALGIFFLLPFAVPMFFWGAPFIPSGQRTAQRMLDLAGVRPGTRFIDLGSGDGRLVLLAAKRGATAVGVELNPWLVCWARRRARRAGLSHTAIFRVGNLWREDLSGYDVVAVYGLDQMMGPLEAKLRRELKPGAVVVSHAFHFSGASPVREEAGVAVYQFT